MKKTTIIAILVLIMFIASLVPIFFIARYNHPSADDYYNALQSHKSWNESRSVTELLKIATQRVYSMYTEWQGTYTTAFLVPLQPAVFGDEYYQLTTYIMLIPFLLGYFYFTKKIIVDVLKQDKASWIIVACMLITISIQLVPYAVSAFYWFNGSVLYTLGHAFMMILFGLVISIIQSKKRWAKILKIVLAVILTLFIGGENFVTALITPLILAVVFVGLLVKKDKNAWAILPVLIFSLIFSSASFLAPGNLVRGGAYEGIGPIKTVLKSMFYGFIYISRIEWKWVMSPASTICFSLAVVPFMIKTIQNKKFKFKYPLFVMFLSLCIFSAQFAPSIYSTSGSGPLRLKNVIYYTYVVLLVFNLTYFCGWVYRKIEELNSDNVERFEKTFNGVYQKTLIPVVSVLIVLGALLMGDKLFMTTSLNAYFSISSGEPQQYQNEYNERIQMLEGDEKVVILNEYDAKPYLLFFDDITHDVNDWRNKAVAEFYQKDSVTLR